MATDKYYNPVQQIKTFDPKEYKSISEFDKAVNDFAKEVNGAYFISGVNKIHVCYTIQIEREMSNEIKRPTS